jgi:hypothetical protein
VADELGILLHPCLGWQPQRLMNYLFLSALSPETILQDEIYVFSHW